MAEEQDDLEGVEEVAFCAGEPQGGVFGQGWAARGSAYGILVVGLLLTAAGCNSGECLSDKSDERRSNTGWV